jgi:hypothetical protein
MAKKKFPTSADFSQTSVVQVHKSANDVIDTFGNADFGNTDSESLSGFGDSDSLFQRQSCSSFYDDSDDYDDEYADEYADEDEDEDEDEEPVNVPQNTSSFVKDAAKQKVEESLRANGADAALIEKVKSLIDNFKAEDITQAVADTLAAKRATFIHPMAALHANAKVKPMSGMGDWFSDLRDTVVQSTATQAEKSAQQLATTAVQAVVAPVAQALSNAANTPQAQAALQQATNTGIDQFQKAISAKASALWTQYRLPILIGSGGLLALTIFLIARRKK